MCKPHRLRPIAGWSVKYVVALEREADEDFIERVYKRLDAGDTLTEALESLADKAAQMMQSDLEQDMDEETMLANWGEREYTIDGLPVN